MEMQHLFLVSLHDDGSDEPAAVSPTHTAPCQSNMEMEEYVNTIKQECLNCYGLQPFEADLSWNDQLPSGTICLDLATWWNLLTEDTLTELRKSNVPISLRIVNIENIPLDVYELVGKWLGPCLFELVVDHCDFTWKGEMKAILHQCAKLASLKLIALKWVDDGIVEQISVRYQKSLRHLELNNCSNITNNALFQIGRRCHQLQSFSVICCTRVSDTGLLELTKHTHLSHIHVAHNLALTDKSLAAMLDAAKDLKSLNVINCPKLTDSSLSSLYETGTAWGKKRSTAGATLKQISLMDNTHFTAQTLLWLSTSATKLERLDLSDCSGLDVVKGMKELYNLTDLQHLKLGPTAKLSDAYVFNEYMGYHAEHLVNLHLVGLVGMTDERIGDLLDALLNLQELTLDAMPFGTTTTEALCSNIPNISRLHLINSEFFGDAELRCIAAVCLHIQELTISKCNRLTDAGFVRFIAFKMLRSLSLGYVSTNCTGNIIKGLAACPLTSLCLDGFTIDVRECFPYLRKDCRIKLRDISLQNAVGVGVEDVKYLVEHFVGCTRIDLTNCRRLLADHLTALRHFNPFLIYSFSSDFSGFQLSNVSKRCYSQYWWNFERLCKHYAARLLQRLRRRYIIRLVEIKQLRREMWNDFKIILLVKIQAMFRSYKARQDVKKTLAAGRRIVRAGRDMVFYREYRKGFLAKKHYRTHLKAKLFGTLKKHHVHLLMKVQHALHVIVTNGAQRLLKRYFNLLLRLRLVFQEIKFEFSALAHWETRFLTKVIRRWNMVIFETYKRRQQLCCMFLMSLPVESWNSLRQQHLLAVADSFRRDRLRIISWMALANDRLEKKRVDSLVPMAIEHFQRSFFKRVCRLINNTWSLYARNKVFKRKKKAFGSAMYKVLRLRNGCVALDNFSLKNKVVNAKLKLGATHFPAYTIRLMLHTRWMIFTRNHIVFTRMAKLVKSHVVARTTRVGFKQFMEGVVRSKMWRVMNKRAESFAANHLYMLIFNAWKEFRIYCHNLEELYVKRYKSKLQRKMWQAFKIGIQASKDFAKMLALEIERKAASEAAFLKAIQSLRIFQARVRGFVRRKKWQEERIAKLYSIQVLQNFFRTYMARKEYMGRYRKRELAERVREDKENDQMRIEEADTLFYLYHVKAATAIQRVYRGLLGRRIAFLLAVDYYRLKNTEFYKVNQHTRLHHQAYLRAAYLREQQRHTAATEIQRIARGKVCRMRYVKIKRHDLMVKKSIIVQRVYRTRLAKMKLLALRRDMFNEIRFREARDRRGLVLRMFGAKKRNQQRFVGAFLSEMGLDPMTFNHKLSELWEDTKNDFFDFITVVKREYLLLREHRFNKLNKMLERRKLLNDSGWKMQVQQAVKIVEPGHPYEGYTGIIVRIDDSVQGNPLYEVSLDRFKRQTFVRMTTDPLKIYEVMQPLAKITLRPDLPLLSSSSAVFGLEPLNPFFCKSNVNAAWAIQSAFRMHRARRIVARKRFEHWSANVARQEALVAHFSQSNSLNTQGYNLANLLKLRSVKPIKFDEIRHKLRPGRLQKVTAKVSESKVIDRELDFRLKDRHKFLQKSALMQAKEFFVNGHELIRSGRKVGMFLSTMLGLVYRRNRSAGDVTGSRGVKYLAGKKALVAGMDRYTFKQFDSSPHVRYYKTQLYQGEWSGVPMVTPLRPHGEGLVVFLDGWGFAKEDKVLYLSIVCCRHLNAMDLASGSSDPYCEIKCNGMVLQTTIKWSNLNPQYHENFEIDVTNPTAKLNIIVKDKDYFGSDDFMGQIELKLEDFKDGRPYHATYQLKGEDLTQPDDGYDQGEIEIRLRWAERKYDDDYQRQELRKVMLIRLQTWARGLAAVTKIKLLREERKKNMEVVYRAAIKVTSMARLRLAMKDYRRRMRSRRAAIKIQKRVRIWIAKRIYRRLKLHSKKAIIIQARMRVCLAKSYVVRLRLQIAADLDATVTKIQKNVRRLLAKGLVAIMRRDNNLVQKAARDIADPAIEVIEEPMSSWILTYGVDPDYRLKRNRRITQRLFKKLLQIKYSKLVSRYGLVYLDSYPPRKSEEEVLNELQDDYVPNDLTDRNDFLSVFVPSFQPIRIRRKAAIEILSKNEHIGILHLPTAIDMRKSVDYTVITIQCAQRQRVARSEYRKMLRVARGITLFQRLFRKRYEVLHRCAVLITSIFHAKLARVRTKHVRRERNGALVIQSAYRCYVARCLMFDFRSVTKLAVLKSSPSVENHGADKALEHRSDTFWIASSPERAEVRVEFAKIENILEIWIQTGTYSASPNYVSIAAVMDKKSGYSELVDRHELPLTKENRWHKFVIPVMSTKYFMLVFLSNYGDEEHISVRQIRFLKSKESSATIVKQPVHYILSPGPCVAEKAEVVLRITATGWPTPTFQWFFNGKIIEGATRPEHKLSLYCPIHGNRVYRCIRCKMVSRNVPMNAYYIQCGNCSYQFTYKEIEDFEKSVLRLKQKEEVLARNKSSLQASMVQMESISNSKYTSMLNEAKERLQAIENELQALRESRVNLKQHAHVVNLFTNEGVYVCEVTNVRGGSLKIKRRSVGTVVLVEKPKPYVVEVIPLYTPRAQTVRKKWTIYSSILGTFRNARLEGLCRIRYNDGAFYEGPYVDEEHIDHWGQTLAVARKANHFGLFKHQDGRVFEGHNVDNHFDSTNLQTFYRVRFPNNEVYEGMFVDETFHGVGTYVFSDGSVYEGQWHRGNRFGHGQLRSKEGWTYEGFFDTNQRHRRGIIDYPDGSCYMGEWYYDKINGQGIFITSLKDVYRGQLQDGKFHGNGQLVYADGSIHTGEFKNGLRHGRGIFIEKEGTELYGHFREDCYHGEMVVKLLIAIEEDGQDNYEIRIGIYDMGTLVKWKSKFSNPIATKQFIHLFRTNRDMFDSVYSMLLAKHLPHLPEGIDANNKKVKSIVFRIRLEAGMLVGEEAYKQAQQQIASILLPYNNKQAQIADLKKRIELVSSNMITNERDSHQLLSKFSHFIAKYEKNTSKIEQFWQDEPTQARINFIFACRKLYTVSTDDYFAFRNHRAVPVFVKKILDAVCYLLGLQADWKLQQMLLSDAASNGRAGDEEALRLNYQCKLAYLMTFGNATGATQNTSIVGAAGDAANGDQAKAAMAVAPAHKNTNAPAGLDPHGKSKRPRYHDDVEEKKMGWGYNVFAHINIKEYDYLAEILADTRFRVDSYYVESTGVAGPVLVNWVKANYAYIVAARDMDLMMKMAEDDRNSAFRFRVQYVRKQDELQENSLNLSALQKEMSDCMGELEELEHALVKAKDLLQFIAGRYQFETHESKQDYYKLLERKLEEKRDFFNVEVCVQGMLDKVVERIDKEKYIKKLQAMGSGTEYVDEDEASRTPCSIIDWLREEVQTQQRSIREGGRTLGYNFEPEATDVTVDYSMQLISLIADIVIGKLNDKYNDLAAARAWYSRKGRHISSRFIFIFAWKIWEEEALLIRDSQAVAAWEDIFGDAVACARAAIEARVNQRMSSIARAQGKVWAQLHKQEVAYAESDMAAEYLEYYNNDRKDAANEALAVERQTAPVNGVTSFDEGLYPPLLRAQTLCFAKLYHDDVQAARDAFYATYAQTFSDKYGLTAGTVAYQLLNGLPSLNGDDDVGFLEYAQHWRDFNLETYEAAGNALRHELSQEFAELYPLNTAYEAAKFVVNLQLHVYLPDEDVKAAFAPNPKHINYAYSYGMLNQGLLRSGKETLLKEYQQQCDRFWTELVAQSQQFNKGSALMASPNEDDRFVGFRNRLASKYGFIFGYLCYRYDELTAEVGKLQYVDPIDKIVHRVRPSEMKTTLYSREHDFLQTKLDTEEHLKDVIAKLAQWNSYFGWVQWDQ